MFNNKRYITRGIEREIPLWLMSYMWNRVDVICRRLKENTDYLQIFKLSTNNGELLIEHTQEQPPLNECIRIKYQGKSINQKIYVIDDEEYSTMLLAEEY